MTSDAAYQMLLILPFVKPNIYGTYVHKELKDRINKEREGERYLNLFPEQSMQKTLEEHDGTPHSIRLDVYEKTKERRICVYDVKTGWRGLSNPRIDEIATTVAREFPDADSFVVTEVRPWQGKSWKPPGL